MLHLWTGNCAQGTGGSGGEEHGNQRKGKGAPNGTMAFTESAEPWRCRRLKGEVTRREDMSLGWCKVKGRGTGKREVRGNIWMQVVIGGRR